MPDGNIPQQRTPLSHYADPTGQSDPLPVIPLGGVSAVILWFILDVEEGLIEGTKHDAVVVGDMIQRGVLSARSDTTKLCPAW